jgi:hypothetical protein
MPEPIYPPGTIRYLTNIGKDGKIYRLKQKYYQVRLEVPWKTPEHYWAYQTDYYYNLVTGLYGSSDYLSEKIFTYPGIIDYFPDKSIDIEKTGFYNFVKKPKLSGNFYKFSDGYYQIIDYNPYPRSNVSTNTFFEQDYQSEPPDDPPPDGTPYRYVNEWSKAGGFKWVVGWANYHSKENTDLDTTPPGALDHDWTLDEVKSKQEDIQFWSDNYLLPPIFGLTNCVYFPSNLGDTKSEDFSSARNPIIKSYPLSNGTIYNNDYDLDFIMTSEFINIKGKKNDIITFNSYFPDFGLNECRFPVIQDFMSFIGDEGETKPPNPFPDACDGIDLKLPKQYKINQIVSLRFIEPEAAENLNLIKEQKFNKYNMIGIITAITTPYKPDLRGSITVKLLKDYGLNEKTYFNARVCIIGNQSNNFIQNKTFCIQRYYKKDLGIGPRLGGSLIPTKSNQTSGEYKDSGKNYMYISLLKDEEKINKPYENISYFGEFATNHDVFGSLEKEIKLEFSYDFSKTDLPGKFVDGIESTELPYSKKFIINYQSYLIKNLDEHSYEYYLSLIHI